MKKLYFNLALIFTFLISSVLFGACGCSNEITELSTSQILNYIENVKVLPNTSLSLFGSSLDLGGTQDDVYAKNYYQTDNTYYYYFDSDGNEIEKPTKLYLYDENLNIYSELYGDISCSGTFCYDLSSTYVENDSTTYDINKEYYTKSGTEYTIVDDSTYSYIKNGSTYVAMTLDYFEEDTYYATDASGTNSKILYDSSTTYYYKSYTYSTLTAKYISNPQFYTYYTKIGAKYYFCSAICDTTNGGYDLYDEERYEVTKEEKDMAVNEISAIIPFFVKNSMLESEINKQQIIELYGNDAYSYSLSGEVFDNGITLKANYIVLGNYEYAYIPYLFNQVDITLENVLLNINTELQLDSNGNLKSLSISQKLIDACDINSQNNWPLYFNINVVEKTFVNIEQDLTKVITPEQTLNVIYTNYLGETLANKTINRFADVEYSSLATPSTVEGYTFDGWYYDNNYENKVPSTFQVGNSDDSLRLYAKYTLTNPISVELNGGMYTSTPNKNSILLDHYLGEVEKIGYSFDGWYADANFENKITINSNTSVQGYSSVYAKFTKLVKVTLNDGNGTKCGYYFGSAGDNIKLPYATFKDGYVFDGWYEDSTYLTSAGATTTLDSKLVWLYTTPTNDITLYAKYAEAINLTFVDHNNTNIVKTIKKGDGVLTLDDLINDIVGNNIFSSYIDMTTNDFYNVCGFCTDSNRTTFISSYPTTDLTLYIKYYSCKIHSIIPQDYEGTYVNSDWSFAVVNRFICTIEGSSTYITQMNNSLAQYILTTEEVYNTLKDDIYKIDDNNSFKLTVSSIQYSVDGGVTKLDLTSNTNFWADVTGLIEFYLTFTESVYTPE